MGAGRGSSAVSYQTPAWGARTGPAVALGSSFSACAAAAGLRAEPGYVTCRSFSLFLISCFPLNAEQGSCYPLNVHAASQEERVAKGWQKAGDKG